MKREEIKKAAEQNISCNSPLDLGAILEGVGRESFVCGAEWRINSVWHDSNDKPDESPKNKRLIIIEHIADGDSLELSYSLIYSHVYAYFCVIRWAYVEDLKPNTEECL